MRCTKCGAELAPEDKFCGECGAPRPRLPAHFEAAEREFAALKARYEAGELSEAEYDAELEKLVIQDEAGAYWMLGAETGQWYRYDGQQWVRADPPLSEARVTAPQPAPAPATAPPAAVAAPKARRLPRWTLVVIPLVLILGAGGLFLATPYGQLARYSIAIALDPQNPDHYFHRARVYQYDLDDLDSAIADLTRRIEISPRAFSYQLRAEVYGEQGNYERALADWSMAIELDPEDVILYMYRAATYELLNRLDSALADYDRAIELDPDYCSWYRRRGDVYRELGDVTRARADYEKVLSITDDACWRWTRDEAEKALAELGTTPVTQAHAVTPTPVLPTPTKVPTPTPIPTPTEALVFEDDFSDNSAGWLEVDAPVRKLWIEGGEYHYMVKTGWEGASEYGWLEKRYSDFVLTTVARQVDDLAGYYGLAFREDDAAVSYYYFIVSGDGYYAVGKRMGREWINMVDWTFSPAINQGQGENILQVVCVGDKISAYVNDQELATVRDDTFAEGYLGLLVGAFDEPGVHVAFDWVMVEPIE